MIGFLIGAVLLLIMAMAFVLPPLLRSGPPRQARRDEINLSLLRDQLSEIDADRAAGLISPLASASARHDLAQRVVEEVRAQPVVVKGASGAPWTASFIGFAIPVVAMALYVLLGAPIALDPMQAGSEGNTAHALTPQQIEAMVDTLATRLKDRPDDVEGWQMLARSYNALERYREASDAYANLVRLRPDDAALLADYADTLAMSLNRSLQGKPEKLIDRALAIDPDNLKAIALSGTAAFERRDYAAAVKRWERIMHLAPANSEIAISTAASIDDAKKMMRLPSADGQVANAGNTRVEGIVELDPVLRSAVAESDTVFVFARAAAGPRAPLAVLRKSVKELPLTFVLDDSMSMVAGAKLSDFPLVVVGARISKSGSATPGAGDLEMLSDPVAPGTKGLKIRISAK
jgi:cytochrome c-type biogenesis protein CcmH